MLMSGKAALVTGAANGIGEEIANLFAREGAHVWLLDKEREKLERVVNRLREEGASAGMCVADLSRTEDVESAIAGIFRETGALDILVNNAGIDPRQPFLEMKEEQWIEVLNVNLNGAYRCTRLVAPHLVEQRAGKVINISSVTFHWGMKFLTHYVASKGALVGFTRALARELGEYNVHVNCITPGAILTERESRTVTPAQAAEVIALQSLQRRILPLDIARVCVFLGTEWSDGITGQTINVDGGWIMR
ncbi:MAG: SDR family NAD(P)-dependent oxidoreductase [Bryobacteraceae bacterium]|jgi:3-oxoacyl-[acyl-carrier protein] reductase